MKAVPILSAACAALAIALAFQTGYLMSEGRGRDRERAAVEPQAKRTAEDYFPASAAPSAPQAFRSQSTASWDEWDPFREMERMRREMDRMFDTSLSRALRESDERPFGGRVFEPVIDFGETKTEYIVRLDAPGIDKDRLSIRAENGMLSIAGERLRESEDAQPGAIQRYERSFGAFRREFPLPSDADATRLKAEAKDGVVTIRLPKIVDPAVAQKK